MVLQPKYLKKMVLLKMPNAWYCSKISDHHKTSMKKDHFILTKNKI